MDESFVYFVLGTVVSIPIAVFSPLLTRHLEKRLARSSGAVARRRRSTLQRDLELARTLRSDFQQYTRFALSRFLSITLISSVLGILPAGLFATASLFLATATNSEGFSAGNNHYGIGMAIESAASFVEIVGAAVIVQLCVRTLRVMNNTRNFTAYEKTVTSQLADLADSASAKRPAREQRPTSSRVTANADYRIRYGPMIPSEPGDQPPNVP